MATTPVAKPVGIKIKEVLTGGPPAKPWVRIDSEPSERNPQGTTMFVSSYGLKDAVGTVITDMMKNDEARAALVAYLQKLKEAGIMLKVDILESPGSGPTPKPSISVVKFLEASREFIMNGTLPLLAEVPADGKGKEKEKAGAEAPGVIGAVEDGPGDQTNLFPPGGKEASGPGSIDESIEEAISKESAGLEKVTNDGGTGGPGDIGDITGSAGDLHEAVSGKEQAKDTGKEKAPETGKEKVPAFKPRPTREEADLLRQTSITREACGNRALATLLPLIESGQLEPLVELWKRRSIEGTDANNPDVQALSAEVVILEMQRLVTKVAINYEHGVVNGLETVLPIVDKQMDEIKREIAEIGKGTKKAPKSDGKDKALEHSEAPGR